MSSPTPPLIPQPFANNAGPSFINTIPDTTGDTQRASFDQGFPSETFQPEESGGKPPLGQDFNGILNAITQHLFALQGGQIQTYRADVSAAISGYKLGAVVAMANGNGLWISTIDNNTEDPDTGGAFWEPVYAFGPTSSAVAGGALTLSAPEAARPYLVFTGSLSGNQQVIVPTTYRSWLVINSCTMNGHTLTVKTAAGTGIDIPAGGPASPTAIYCDGTNVQVQFLPSAIPTSVAADPNTIPLRDNTGIAYGVTPAAGDRSTALATTEFANPLSSPGPNGFQRFPNGLLIQWGNFPSPNTGARTVNFPIAFPNNVFVVVPSQGRSVNYGYPFSVASLNLSGFTTDASAANGIAAGTCYYIAIGN